MNRTLVITGTDTGIGKTVIAAGLAGLLGGAVWKPVQSGLDGETDSQTVAHLGELMPARILPEAWRLTRPLSPHRAAELESVAIDPDRRRRCFQRGHRCRGHDRRGQRWGRSCSSAATM